METWQAAFLGFLEGLTEYLPVSSTGHILLAGHFLGAKSPGHSFEVLIQLGAILAILTVYFAKLLNIVLALPSDARARRFVAAVLLAFLPAAVAGAFLHSYIKGVLFETPQLICWMLILGGVILLVVDAMDFPPAMALKIGLCQMLAMIPGVSRSGSTIVGALLLGADKRAAAEFSFFLAMPTMAGAFAYDLYKNWDVIRPGDATSIAIGFIAAFVTGVIVVRYVLDFISRHGFSLFAWWRILVGGLGLAALSTFG
jgi:undecaprenyl-diphosphatase